MAKKKRGDSHGGGHGWFVTFADLMGLMMSFFVMPVAFSTQDANKLKVVAGSMRDAFGGPTAGHPAAGSVPTRSDYGGFDLSADRANAVRQILEREGLPPSHVFAVAGKADTQPLFPDDPSLAANRRVTITLMREDPPLPPNLKP